MPKRTPNKAIHTYIKKSVQKELPNFYSTELQKSMDQTMNQLLAPCTRREGAVCHEKKELCSADGRDTACHLQTAEQGIVPV